MARPRRLQLDNGLTVILHQHRAAPVAAVQLWLGVGARDETEAESGFSHFIEHLLFKGTPSRGPGVIDQTISGLGGEMNAATSQDFTYYHIVLPSRHLETALEVVADAARAAAFDPGELERERLVVLEEIRRARDNPGAYLWRVLTRRHFPDHPYGRDVLGTPETIGGAPRERIVEYYRRHYRPANAAVVVAGDVEPETALAGVRRAFRAWEAGPATPSVVPELPDLPGVQRVVETRPLQQAYLGVAWRGPVVPAADVYTTELLTAILGRGRASRLNQTLKEEQGLVSTIGASFYAQRSAGTITVTARADAERQGKFEDALVAELERLRTGGVTDAELTRARTNVESGYAFGHETAEGAAYSYGLAETVWTLDFELTYLDEIRGVTREQVEGAARRYLRPDRYTAAAVGPADGVR
jgi:zinc protease